MPREEILRVRLRALEPRSSWPGPNAAQPRFRKRVDDAEHERTFRTDDRQVDRLRGGESHEPGDVFGCDLDVARLRLERGARIAGRDEHLRHARRLRDLPRERVLAASATDDEDTHGQCLK